MSRARFAEVVNTQPLDLARACLLIGCEVEPDLDIDGSLATLHTLDTLRDFTTSQASDVRLYLLHEVLRRRQAAPLLITVLRREHDRHDSLELLAAVLAGIRSVAAAQPRSLDAARTQLWASELALLLPGAPLDLRREHGELLIRLGEFARGAEELEYFAAQTEDDAALNHARQARARLN